MTAEEKTLKKLKYLEMLYHQGYRSDTIDRSLEKIIALERARNGSWTISELDCRSSRRDII